MKRRYGISVVMAGALIALMSACATTDRTAVRTPAPQGTCVPADLLSTWDALDDRSIVLLSPDETSGYLLTLDTPIAGLSDAQAIDVIDSDLDGQGCANGRDGIVAPDCDCQAAIVAAIELLSPSRLAELLAPRSVTISI
jgi:hypothetical protein